MQTNSVPTWFMPCLRQSVAGLSLQTSRWFFHLEDFYVWSFECASCASELLEYIFHTSNKIKRFSQLCWWFMSSGLWCHVNWQIVTGCLMQLSFSIFRAWAVKELKMEAAGFCYTLLTIHQLMWCHIWQDLNLNIILVSIALQCLDYK